MTDTKELIARLRDLVILDEVRSDNALGREAADEISRLLNALADMIRQRDEDHRNINLKADFIEATLDQLAEMEQQRDEARVMALKEAADIAKLYHEKAIARFETLPSGGDKLRSAECASTAGSIEMAIRRLAEGANP